MGAVAGSYSCNGVDAGPFQLTEMQVNPTGVTGRFRATSTAQTGCQSTGWFGGIHVNTFHVLMRYCLRRATESPRPRGNVLRRKQQNRRERERARLAIAAPPSTFGRQSAC